MMIGENLPRDARYMEGKEAEERIKAYLQTEGYLIKESPGTNGEPDIVAEHPHRNHVFYRLAVEVKSIWPYAKSTKSTQRGSQVSGIRWPLEELEGLKNWARENDAQAILIVEVRIPHSGKGPIYLWVYPEDLPRPKKSKAWLYSSFYDLVALQFRAVRPGLISTPEEVAEEAQEASS